MVLAYLSYVQPSTALFFVSVTKLFVLVIIIIIIVVVVVVVVVVTNNNKPK